MNTVLFYIFLFFIGSICGWIIELLYRRFKPSNKDKKWVNPGFLNGPYVPIYGFGVCALYTVSLFKNSIKTDNNIINFIIVFFIMLLVLTLIELIAGEIFIIGFKVKLWDYSREKLNYKGIICLRFSVIWAILGTFYYYVINKFFVSLSAWFVNHLSFSFILGVFFGVFIIDVIYSCNLVAKIRKFAKEKDILVRFEELKDNIAKEIEKHKEKRRFLFSFNSELPLHEHLKNYYENLSKKHYKNK